MSDRPPFDPVPSDPVPFDPVPRPGEVATIVSRARRRKAIRAAVPVSSAAAIAVAFALTTGATSQSPQELEFARDPSGRVTTSTAAPSGTAQPGGGPGAGTGATPTSITLPPPVGASPSSSTPASPQPSTRPGERSAYRKQLGPKVEEYGYAACRQRQLAPGSRALVHAGYCIEPVFTAPTSSRTTDLAPGLRICWQAESVYNGYLDYPTQEELDIALYVADVDDAGRTVPGRKLFRFADTVTYGQRSHQIRVLQGDCLLWQGRLDFDASRYGEGDYLLRVRTPTTTFRAAYRTYDVTFTV